MVRQRQLKILTFYNLSKHNNLTSPEDDAESPQHARNISNTI